MTEQWTGERVAREAGCPPMPPRAAPPGFSLLRHRTLKRYRQAIEEWRQAERVTLLAWNRECSERRLALFDRHVESLGFKVPSGPQPITPDPGKWQR